MSMYSPIPQREQLLKAELEAAFKKIIDEYKNDTAGIGCKVTLNLELVPEFESYDPRKMERLERLGIYYARSRMESRNTDSQLKYGAGALLMLGLFVAVFVGF